MRDLTREEPEDGGVDPWEAAEARGNEPPTTETDLLVWPSEPDASIKEGQQDEGGERNEGNEADDDQRSEKSSPMIFDVDSPIKHEFRKITGAFPPLGQVGVLLDTPDPAEEDANTELSDSEASLTEDLESEELAELSRKIRDLAVQLHIRCDECDNIRQDLAVAVEKIEIYEAMATDYDVEISQLVSQIEDQEKKLKGREGKQDDKLQVSMVHLGVEPQFKTITEILQGCPAKDANADATKEEETKVEANAIDQLNFFHIQHMMNLRALILEALQQGWEQGVETMLSIFNDWCHHVADQLMGLDKDVAREINGSLCVLESCWYLWYEKDLAKARESQQRGFHLLKEVSKPFKTRIYIELAKSLSKEIENIQERTGPAAYTNAGELAGSVAHAARLAGVSENLVWTWKEEKEAKEIKGREVEASA